MYRPINTVIILRIISSCGIIMKWVNRVNKNKTYLWTWIISSFLLLYFSVHDNSSRWIFSIAWVNHTMSHRHDRYIVKNSQIRLNDFWKLILNFERLSWLFSFYWLEAITHRLYESWITVLLCHLVPTIYVENL